MTSSAEWSREFDIMWNNITSNQAPGLSEYEKSVLLTRAQEGLVKDIFSGKTNILGEGFDDSERRQSDFSTLIETVGLTAATTPSETGSSVPLDKRSDNHYYQFPTNILVVLNEVVVATKSSVDYVYTVVPISYVEYSRIMRKPYKYPAKGLAWRLITGTGSTTTGEGQSEVTTYYKRAELIARFPSGSSIVYTLRYVRRPKPIVLEGVSLENTEFTVDGDNGEEICELPEHLHEEILFRAVQLAKVAWSDPAALQSKQNN